MYEVVEELSVREVVVVPFAYHLTEHRVAFGHQVFKKVVVGNVEVLELMAEADVERDELVVAHSCGQLLAANSVVWLSLAKRVTNAGRSCT